MKIIVTPDDWSTARLVPSAELATAIAALAPGQYDLAFATPQGNFEVKPVDVPEDPPVNEPADPVDPPVAPVDVTPVKLSVLGGRVAILDVEAPGSVLQHDGKYALDLGSVDAAETRRFTTPAGQQVTLDIAAPGQLAKWGEGTHYMLERDLTTEDIIIEPGRNHRKLYLTAGPHGYTKAEIAAEAGVTEATVTNAWLKANPLWGGSPEKALEPVIGLLLWNFITANKGKVVNKKQSHWLLLERGYTYDVGRLGSAHFMAEGVDGESQLHPMVIGSYGTGKEPILGGRGIQAFSEPHNVAIVGVSLGATNNHLTGHHILFADVRNEPGETEVAFSKGANWRTLYRCMIADVHNIAPRGGRTTWANVHGDRISGLFINAVEHMLIEDPFLDHNGWKDGYDPLNLDYAHNQSQPRSIYSHNAYLSYDNRDLTFVGGITARGASMGLQVRSGGRVQDNLFLDNQQAATLGTGGGDDNPGNYTLLLRNVFTSASYDKNVGPSGAFNRGADVQGENTVSLDNIVCHMADPNNPAEKTAKPKPGKAIWVSLGADLKPITTMEFDNQINWNWEATNRNVEGLNPATLNARTIQNFAATKLPGGTAPTIKNLMNWMKTLTPRQRQLIQREALTFMRAPYDPKLEMSAVKRTTPAVCVFRPDPRCEGFLWDNPMNWSTGDLPGTVEGDTVDLHGNFVRFGRLTVSIPINFNGGKLDVVSGKLTCTAQTDLADVTVRNSGQYFAPENAHGSYVASGGRLAFTGAATVDLDVSGEAECLIGPALTIMEGVIQGADCWVGWDGTGTATATGPLAIMEVGGKVGKLQRFKRRGDAPNPTINATYALTALNIDVTTPGTYDLGGGAGTGVTYTNPNNITLPAGVTLGGGKLILTV